MTTASCCAASASLIPLYYVAQPGRAAPGGGIEPGERAAWRQLRRELPRRPGRHKRRPASPWPSGRSPRQSDGYVDGVVRRPLPGPHRGVLPSPASRRGSMTPSPPSHISPAQCDGGGTSDIRANTTDPTCSHPVASPRPLCGADRPVCPSPGTCRSCVGAWIPLGRDPRGRPGICLRTTTSLNADWAAGSRRGHVRRLLVIWVSWNRWCCRGLRSGSIDTGGTIWG